MESNNWSNERLVVTGGAGFLGQFVIDKLKSRGATDIVVPRSAEYNLVNEADVARLYKDAEPTMVIHLAASVGGIGANRDNPGKFFYDNMAMGLHLIEYARRHGCKKFVCTGTICAYPKYTPVPFKEEHLWEGYPEETNAPYGIAKKALLVMLQSYRQQYGMNGIYLLPVNLYGPRDNFDPNSSHVIPALIKKCIDARDEKQEYIEVWGTGRATREFLYVEDCADAIVTATEKYNNPDAINIGAGCEISIRELVEQIVELTGYKGEIRWDRSKPDGQPRRMLDTKKANTAFGFEAQMDFTEGLRRTISWYEEHRTVSRAKPPLKKSNKVEAAAV